MDNNKKSWFSQITTRPSPDEFDERFRAINSQAFRDALIAVVVTMVLIIGIMQIPSLRTFSTWLFIVALPSAFIVGSVTYIVSRILKRRLDLEPCSILGLDCAVNVSFPYRKLYWTRAGKR
jgi:hypothetical protein